MIVSEYIFDFFANKGIDTAFMLTGGQAMWLNDAIGKSGRYNIICTHHEQSAAMSADAYGRILNKPALTVVTAGPGSVNAVNGVVGGYTDSSPMILISGQSALRFVKYQEETGIRQHGIQGINIKPMVEKFTKYFITIDDPRKLKKYLEEAYEAAINGRPGPVWIDVPIDVQPMQVDMNSLEEPVHEFFEQNDEQFKKDVDRVYELLQKSRRPLFIAGQGISLSGSREIFRDFLDKVQVPLVTARLGIDLIESEHRLYVGRPGNYGERSANFAVQNADLIISAGCRLSSSTVGHDPHQFGKNAVIVMIDIDDKELNKPGVKIDYKIQGDCKKVIQLMNQKLEEISLPNYDHWIDICNQWKNNYPVVQEHYKDESPINSYYFTDRLSTLTDNKTMILVDTGSCFHVACQSWKVKKGQRYLTTGGISSMGYWVAGIGACMANKKNNTIVITGDGSLQMNLQEFAVIRHNNLPIKVFIFNNNGYLLIRHTQRNFMDNRLIGEGPSSGVWCPDSVEIAKAYGIYYVKIEKVEEVDQKIKEVLAYNGPVICDVITQEWQELIPRITSEKLPDGRLVPRNYEDMYPYLAREELKKNMIVDDEI